MASLSLVFDLLVRDRGASQAFDQFGNAIQNAGNQGEGFASKLSGSLAKAGPIVAAAGAVAGAALVAGLLEAVDQQKASNRLAAQLNLDPAEQKRAGQVAGDVFAGAYGESLDQVNEAVRNVVQNIGVDLNSVDLQPITEGVLSLADTFDQDLNSVTRAAGDLLRNKLAPDATTALDIITAGFQGGADRSGDFLDTLNEYSPQFAKLGLDAEAATGLLSQGLQNGARNADIVADAIKEFSIRAIDGSKLTGESFEALGLDAEDMAGKIAQGGPTAKQAFATVLKAIQSIEDPVERNIVGVGLFGTQFEDLGPSAVLGLDPMNAGMDKTSGRLDALNKKVGDDAGTAIESFKRKAQQVFVEYLGSEVIPKVETFIQQFKDGEGAGGRLREAFDKVKKTLQDNKPELIAVGDFLARIGEFVLTKVIPVLVDLEANKLAAVVRAVNNVKTAFDTMKTGATLLIEQVTELGRRLKTWVTDRVDAAKGALDDFTGAMRAFKIPGWVRSLGDLLSGIGGAFKSGFNAVKGGLGDGPGIGGSPGDQPRGVKAMMAALPAGTRLISGFRPGAVTATGNPSYHGKGRAVDLPPSLPLFNYIKARFPDSRELIYTPAGGRQIHNGREFLYKGVTAKNHLDHVHWAYDRGGVANGIGLIPKLTNRPERVLSPDQTLAFDRLVSALERGGNDQSLAVLHAILASNERQERLSRDLGERLESLERRGQVGG